MLMTICEFCNKVGFYVTQEEWGEIEKDYIMSPLGDDDFVRSWVKNGGVMPLLKSRRERMVELGERVMELVKTVVHLKSELVKARKEKELEVERVRKENELKLALRDLEIDRLKGLVEVAETELCKRDLVIERLKSMKSPAEKDRDMTADMLDDLFYLVKEITE